MKGYRRDGKKEKEEKTPDNRGAVRELLSA